MAAMKCRGELHQTEPCLPDASVDGPDSATLKQRFLAAVMRGELGSLEPQGYIVTDDHEPYTVCVSFESGGVFIAPGCDETWIGGIWACSEIGGRRLRCLFLPGPAGVACFINTGQFKNTLYLYLYKFCAL